MEKFKKLFFLLSSNDRKRASLLLIIIVIMALLDMIGVASILPFIAVITNPDLIETNIILNKMFKVSNMFGIDTNQEFMFLLGISVFTLLIISLTLRSFVVYLQSRFAQMCEYSISTRLVEGYLNQSYEWIISRHSADLAKNILSEANQIVSMGINTVIDLIAKSIVTIALIVLLFIVDLKLTLIIGFTIGCSYLTIFIFVSRYLNLIGKDRLKNNQLRFTAISEAFGATKELKIGGLEKIYVKSFSYFAQILAKTQASISLVAQLPRFILEAISFGGVLLLILYKLSRADSGFNDIIPIISLFAYAGYRLLPAAQQIYTSFTRLAFIGPALDKLYDDLKNLKPYIKNENHDVLNFNKSITLNDIYYTYPNSSRKALESISLNIPIKSTIGLIGTTGSGKTTVIDVILGLLKPQKGTLEVDEKIITDQNIRSLQGLIGYVPQYIFLVDNSISANIALGEDVENIDQSLVEKVSKISNIHEFIINELPEKYQTHIGERGIRLSGGQRQRIGIARALYRQPKLLVLDEATNALDNITEKKVMENIYNLSKKITIVIVAHRLDTIKNCDIIYRLNKGKIAEKIKYNDLVNINND